MAPENDELQNPYVVHCHRHGTFTGPIDQCPECAREDDRASGARIPVSICWDCANNGNDEPSDTVSCAHYGFPMRPIRRNCKYFVQFVPPW